MNMFEITQLLYSYDSRCQPSQPDFPSNYFIMALALLSPHLEMRGGSGDRGSIGAQVWALLPELPLRRSLYEAEGVA